MSGAGLQRTVAFLLVLIVVASALLPPSIVRAQATTPPDATDQPPVVDGIALKRTTVAGLPIYFDPDVEPVVVAVAGEALADGLVDVPALTGLPPFSTPIEVYLLADDERFRQALAEIGQVRVDLVADEIGGYTIERNGTMLVFLAAPNLAEPASATLGFAHELAHLAVREATQRRALPQWFNEGYASWISTRALARRYPDEARLQEALDRATVASALQTRARLIPWPELVTRSRFSRAGVEGLVGLAYGQSTLFVDWLAGRFGVPALARFLTGIGDGASATQAFEAAFAPFGPESAAYEASLQALRQEYPAGLFVIQRATTARPVILVMVGGDAGKTDVVELFENGELSRRRELPVDGAGVLVASIPPGLLDEGTSLRVRVSDSLLGTLELDPIAETRLTPSAFPYAPPGLATAPSTVPAPPRPTPPPSAPGPVPAPAQAPSPAPAQLPR